MGRGRFMVFFPLWGQLQQQRNSSTLSLSRRLKALLPEESQPAPVTYAFPLVAFVGFLIALSLVVILLTLRPVSDLLTLGIGAAVVFAAAYCSAKRVSSSCRSSRSRAAGASWRSCETTWRLSA